jgi:hypothetical protein
VTIRSDSDSGGLLRPGTRDYGGLMTPGPADSDSDTGTEPRRSQPGLSGTGIQVTDRGSQAAAPTAAVTVSEPASAEPESESDSEQRPEPEAPPSQ